MTFASFRFDPDSGELRTEGGRQVFLQPQPARLLALLLRRAGERVSREEIREHLWGDTQVDVDAGVNFAIRCIRRALDDPAEAPRFVETLPRRGYRFIMSCRRVTDPRPVPLDEGPPDEGPLDDRAPDDRPPAAGFGPPGREAPRPSPGALWMRGVGATLGLVAVAVLGWIALRTAPLSIGAPHPVAELQGSRKGEDARLRARDAYLRGRYLLKLPASANRDAAVSLFRRSLAADPTFAPAYLGLEEAQRWTLSAQEKRRLLEEAARWAPSLPGIASGLAWSELFDERRPEAALELFDRDLRREAPDLGTLHGAALAAAALGRWDTALAHLEDALVLGPAETAIFGDAAQILFWAGRSEEALQQVERALELDPGYDDIRWTALTHQVAYGDWPRAARQASALTPEDRRRPREPEPADTEGCRRRVEDFLRGMMAYHRQPGQSPLPAGTLAELLLSLGRWEDALDQLELAVEERWYGLVYLGADPRWDPVREDPRFKALLAELGVVDRRPLRAM